MEKDEIQKILIEVSKNERSTDEFIEILGNIHAKMHKKEHKQKLPAIYKPAWKVRGADFYYCVSGETGQVILVKKDVINGDESKEIKAEKLHFNGNKQDAWVINIKNGYLVQGNLPCNIAKYTDVYSFVAVAYWQELEKFNDELINNFKKHYPKENIRLELHHISGNIDDNTLSNLIYIPAFIHRRVHKLELES